MKFFFGLLTLIFLAGGYVGSELYHEGSNPERAIQKLEFNLSRSQQTLLEEDAFSVEHELHYLAFKATQFGGDALFSFARMAVIAGYTHPQYGYARVLVIAKWTIYLLVVVYVWPLWVVIGVLSYEGYKWWKRKKENTKRMA